MKAFSCVLFAAAAWLCVATDPTPAPGQYTDGSVVAVASLLRSRQDRRETPQPVGSPTEQPPAEEAPPQQPQQPPQSSMDTTTPEQLDVNMLLGDIVQQLPTDKRDAFRDFLTELQRKKDVGEIESVSEAILQQAPSIVGQDLWQQCIALQRLRFPAWARNILKPSIVRKMKIDTLRVELERRGLSTDGLKAALRDRLLAAIKPACEFVGPMVCEPVKKVLKRALDGIVSVAAPLAKKAKLEQYFILETKPKKPLHIMVSKASKADAWHLFEANKRGGIINNGNATWSIDDRIPVYDVLTKSWPDDDPGFHPIWHIVQECIDENRCLSHEGVHINCMTGKPLSADDSARIAAFYKTHPNKPVLARGATVQMTGTGKHRADPEVKAKGCFYLVGFSATVTSMVLYEEVGGCVEIKFWVPHDRAMSSP